MNPNKALWEKGDFTRIATSMRESGEAVVATLGITEGLEVLDLGCGDGTTALPEASVGRTCWGSILPAISSRPATRVLSSSASLTAAFRRATRRICTTSMTIASISW